MPGSRTAPTRQAIVLLHTLLWLTALGAAPAGAQGVASADSSARAKPRNLPPPAPVTSGALYDTLLRADRELAEAMYGVECSPALVATLITEDAEFYDDIVGFESRAQRLAYLELLAGSCQTERSVERRVLPGTFRAYPLGADAAMSTGFEHIRSRQNGRIDIAQFTTIWRRGADGQWRASRLITFDHRAVTRS
jgi:hypothetical protein